MITELDLTVIGEVYSGLIAKASGKYRVSMRIDNMDDVRIVLTDDNYNPIFSHAWQYGDTAASFASSLDARIKETGILN